MTHLKRLLNDLLDRLAQYVDLDMDWPNFPGDEDD